MTISVMSAVKKGKAPGSASIPKNEEQAKILYENQPPRIGDPDR